MNAFKTLELFHTMLVVSTMCTLTLVASEGIRAQSKTGKPNAAASATLAQAVVVEFYEHDLGKAMEMYRSIAADQSRSADTRAQAHLRLGKAYQRLGEQAEARTNFQRAAAGSGAASREAADILAGRAQDHGDLVKAKVKQALTAMRLTGKYEGTDLLWIGRPAVPHIIKALDAEKADLRFITNATTVLFLLGGPQVLEWIDKQKKSSDVLRKRAVIKSFLGGEDEVGSRVATFLSDADATVRLEVLNGMRLYSAAQAIAALEDSNERVRQAALQQLLVAWRELRHDGKAFENFQRMLPYLEKAETTDHYRLGGIQGWVAGVQSTPSPTVHRSTPSKSNFPATEAGRRVFLQAAALDYFRNTPMLWPSIGESASENMLAAELLAVARKNGEIGRNRLLGALEDLLPHWDRTVMGSVLELAALGYDSNGVLSKWVCERGTAADAEAVAAKLGSLRDSKSVCDWLVQVGVPGSALPGLEALAERDYNYDTFPTINEAIRCIDSDASASYVVEQLRRGKHKFWNAKTDVGLKRILTKLLVLPGKGDADQKLRLAAFRALLAGYKDPGDPALFARAYEIGMGSSRWRKFYSQGAAMPYSRDLRRGLYHTGAPRRHGYLASEQSCAGILDACLTTGNLEAFMDLSWMLDFKVDRAISTVVARHVLRCPDVKNASGDSARVELLRAAMKTIDSRDASTLALAALEHRDARLRSVAAQTFKIPSDADPAIVRAFIPRLEDSNVLVRRNAAKHLSDSETQVAGLDDAMIARLGDPDFVVVQHAVRHLGRRSPEKLLQHADALAKHPDPGVRLTSASWLLSKLGTKVIDRVGPILVDEQVTVASRKSILAKLGSLMDLAVVPHLLAALKSPDLQADAQVQLGAVQFYHEQTSKWERYMKGAGFAETSAAEALMEQAKSKDKTIRLAAIASLGTLGEAETLPFLIKLMSDSDSLIKRAAAEAVARINSSGNRK